MGKMRLSKSYFPTLRENVRDEDSISGNLLVRAGYIKKVGAGIYTLLPLGYKVARKLEAIVREEMDAIGSQELAMPMLIPSEVYSVSGRLENFGPSIFKLQDRYARDYVLGPTHEELFTEVAKQAVVSYKDLPLSLYQIQTKFRDEPRPRFGLIRVRQFTMKDAYTFARSYEELEEQYRDMFNAYKRIFERMGIKYTVVQADTGVMGGLLSEEFQALSDIGEDILVMEAGSEYASNLEIAACLPEIKENLPSYLLNFEAIDEIDNTHQVSAETVNLQQEKIATPNCHTIDDLSQNYDIPATKLVKTLIYRINGEVAVDGSQSGGELVAILVRGDREVNESKVQKLLQAQSVMLADEAAVQAVTQAPIGFAGPFGLNCRFLIDPEALLLEDFVVGANEKDAHLIHCSWRQHAAVYPLLVKLLEDSAVSLDKLTDVAASLQLSKSLPLIDGKITVADVRNIMENDYCANGKGRVSFRRGIEIGNTFKLGDKYSKSLDLTYTDENNKQQYPIMGCYGIGIGRCMAALAEQNYAEKGLLWSRDLAPIQVAIVIVNTANESQVKVANELYEAFDGTQLEVVLDDRKERAGVKFNDMELVGAYARITVGRGVDNGTVELKLNGFDLSEAEKQNCDLPISEVVEKVSSLFAEH